MKNVKAIVLSAARERQEYEGRGGSRRVVGRLTDAQKRPVSGASAVIVAEPVGMLPDAVILAPDFYGEVLRALTGSGSTTCGIRRQVS